MHLQAAGMPVLRPGHDPACQACQREGHHRYVRNGRLIGIVGRDNPRGMLHWTAELQRELRRSETLTNRRARVRPGTAGTVGSERRKSWNAMYAN